MPHTYCLSTAKMVTRTRLNVTYVRYLLLLNNTVHLDKGTEGGKKGEKDKVRRKGNTMTEQD
jgi:hypothetical protein